MSRVIAFVACGFTLAACSSSLPGLDFLKGAPPTETLRIESDPPGAEVRLSQGQNCRTPCEIPVQVADLTVTLTLNGYHPQTIAVAPAAGQPSGLLAGSSAPKLAPNPILAELQVMPPPGPAKKKPLKKRRPAVAKQVPAPAPAPVAGVAPAPEPAPPPVAPGPNTYPWPSR